MAAQIGNQKVKHRAGILMVTLFCQCVFSHISDYKVFNNVHGLCVA
ncbi:MAG: hypothetical protein JWR05_3344 [Mucilaginibacter sp.]|jgi:hypothetical protein|nr:hypothetical protein [Mucilaginibacter sp.]